MQEKTSKTNTIEREKADLISFLGRGKQKKLKNVPPTSSLVRDNM